MGKLIATLSALAVMLVGLPSASASTRSASAAGTSAIAAASCSESSWPIQYDYRYVKQNWVGTYFRDMLTGKCRHQAIWESELEYKRCRVLRQYYQVRGNYSRGYIHYRCPKGEYWRYSEWARM